MTHHKSVICSGQSNLMHVDGMLSQSADPYESEKAFDFGLALVWNWSEMSSLGLLWSETDLSVLWAITRVNITVGTTYRFETVVANLIRDWSLILEWSDLVWYKYDLVWNLVCFGIGYTVWILISKSLSWSISSSGYVGCCDWTSIFEILELWIASLRLCLIGKFSATPFQDALNIYLRQVSGIRYKSFFNLLQNFMISSGVRAEDSILEKNLQRCILHSWRWWFLIILANISSWLVHMRMHFFCVLLEARLIFSNIQI